MIKLTLLEIVQDMLTAIEAENVDSVGDTEEAGMCVSHANMAFEEVASSKRWNHFRQYMQLDNNANANQLDLLSGTIAVDKDLLYVSGKRVKWMDPRHFLDFTIQRDTSAANITTIDNIKVYTDRAPTYFTSDDDETIKFDSYDTTAISGVDALTLGWRTPTSRLTADNEVFDLPAVCFPALSAMCVARAISLLKQDTEEGTKQERHAKGLLSRLSHTHRLIDNTTDIRGFIVPRKTNRNVQSNTVSYSS